MLLGFRTFIIGCAALLLACGPEKTSRSDVHGSQYDGVYARLFGGFDRETLVIDGDRFLWWFATDTNQPDVFPLSGKIHLGEGRLELTYEVSGEEFGNASSVFPPEYFVIERQHDVTGFRSVRFGDPFAEEFGACLFPTTLAVTGNRAEFPIALSDQNASPEVQEVIAAIEKSRRND